MIARREHHDLGGIRLKAILDTLGPVQSASEVWHAAIQNAVDESDAESDVVELNWLNEIVTGAETLSAVAAQLVGIGAAQLDAGQRRNYSEAEVQFEAVLARFGRVERELIARVQGYGSAAMNERSSQRHHQVEAACTMSITALKDCIQASFLALNFSPATAELPALHTRRRA